MKTKRMPKPVKHDSRICFGIDFFTSEEDAKEYARMIEKRGDTYKGGFFDGMACGRAPEFDYLDGATGGANAKPVKLYAVTVA